MLQFPFPGLVPPRQCRRRVRLVATAFAAWLAASVAAPGQGPDPGAVLEQARARLRAVARGLDNYVCVETLDRGYYGRVAAGGETPSGGWQLESTDRARLEVTVSRGRELHSWPGATRFDSRDVDELIRDGPVSTGAFGAYLAGVFDNPSIAFQFNGERSAHGKTAFEYGYRVPVGASRFQIKVGTAWRAAAYEGEFRIDPQSLDLEQMTVRTSQLPPGAAFLQAGATLDYQHVRIGAGDVLLPRQSQLEILLPGGRETRNTVAFSSCREYRAESEIVYDAPPETESAAVPRAGRGRVALPIGLPVTLALAAPIDTAAAAAGDPVEAKVVKPVRRPESKEDLIPAGAVARGRIRRVEHHLLPTPYFLIAMSFNRVEIQGVIFPFVARSEPDADRARELGVNLAVRESGVWSWGVGTFLFPTGKSRMAIPAGSESQWFTLATGGR